MHALEYYNDNGPLCHLEKRIHVTYFAIFRIKEIAFKKI